MSSPMIARRLSFDSVVNVPRTSPTRSIDALNAALSHASINSVSPTDLSMLSPFPVTPVQKTNSLGGCSGAAVFDCSAIGVATPTVVPSPLTAPAPPNSLSSIPSVSMPPSIRPIHQKTCRQLFMHDDVDVDDHEGATDGKADEFSSGSDACMTTKEAVGLLSPVAIASASPLVPITASSTTHSTRLALPRTPVKQSAPIPVPPRNVNRGVQSPLPPHKYVYTTPMNSYRHAPHTVFGDDE